MSHKKSKTPKTKTNANAKAKALINIPSKILDNHFIIFRKANDIIIGGKNKVFVVYRNFPQYTSNPENDTQNVL